MYKTKRSKENRQRIKIRLDALKNADEFAKQTFLALKNDDTCWKRFLRALKIIPPQKIE